MALQARVMTTTADDGAARARRNGNNVTFERGEGRWEGDLRADFCRTQCAGNEMDGSVVWGA